jgi:GntR family galactonate operon transcriptional repressor
MNLIGSAGPVRRRGLHREVVGSLGRRIVRGELQPGLSLPNEADLSLELGVSRTVVREAIKVLASKGLVESRPKTGTRVLPRANWSLADPDVLRWRLETGPDAALLHEISEVRAFIEPHAAGLAAARHTTAEGERLARWLDQMEASLDDAEAYIAADLAFHSEILAATHNELLAQITGTVSAALEASREVSTQAPGGPRTAQGLHREVATAILAHDRDRAISAMEALIRRTAHDIDEVLHPSQTTGAGRVA